MFPKYFVLEQLRQKYKSSRSLEDYYIISVQHLMRSTGSLFETLIKWGIIPDQIFLTGKIYSAHYESIEKIKQLGINFLKPTIPDRLGYYSDFLERDVLELWNQLRKALKPNAKIIILDDGGFVLKNVPSDILGKYPVFGIEQTTSGVRLQNAFKEFPVIHVATSAAKTLIEPPIVSEAVKIQLGEVIKELKPKTIGIVGFGHVGKAIAADFSNDYNIVIYDKKNIVNKDKEFIHAESIDSLYESSDVIISATGNDISKIEWLENSNGNKTLLSVSSGDIEFNTLIRNCMPYMTEKFESPLQDLNLKTKNGKRLKILRGGLVANFTGKPDSSPGHAIQMTRGLLFSAIIQIVEEYLQIKGQIGRVALKSQLQKEVIKLWLQDQPERKKIYNKELIKNFNNIKWIANHSEI
jgi:S-adenosylhomocysteine hydrolase